MTEQALPKIDDRIRLIEMPNDPHPVEVGTKGTVTFVNEAVRQIGVAWDNGRSLILVIGVDRFEILGTYEVKLVACAALNTNHYEIEAASPDEACELARKEAEEDDQQDWDVLEQQGSIPFVNELYDPEGTEIAIPFEHGEQAIIFPESVATADAVSEVVAEIDAFDVECEETQHTDTDRLWELLKAWRERLAGVLPEDVRLDLDEALAASRQASRGQLQAETDADLADGQAA